MDDVEHADAVIASCPRKSPPVFNVILEKATKHNVASALVFLPDADHLTGAHTDWQAYYGHNIARARDAGQPLLVILHDDCMLGNTQKRDIRFLEGLGEDFQLLTVRQFLERYCAASKKTNTSASGLWYIAGGDAWVWEISYNKDGTRSEGGRCLDGTDSDCCVVFNCLAPSQP